MPAKRAPGRRSSGWTRQNPCRCDPRLRASLTEDLDEAVHNFGQLRGRYVPGPVEDDPLIRREQPIRPDSAASLQSARGKVGGFKGHGTGVGARLAADLAENRIITGQRCQHQCGLARHLRRGRARETADPPEASAFRSGVSRARTKRSLARHTARGSCESTARSPRDRRQISARFRIRVAHAA